MIQYCLNFLNIQRFDFYRFFEPMLCMHLHIVLVLFDFFDLLLQFFRMLILARLSKIYFSQKCMREPCKTSSCRAKPLRIKKIVQRFTAPINNRTTVLTQNLNIPIRVVSSVKIFTTNVLKKTAEQLFDATLHEVVPKNAVSSKKTSTNKSGSSRKSSTRIDVKLMKPLNVVSGVYHNKIYVTLKTKRRTERLLTELYLILESPGGDIMDLELEDNRWKWKRFFSNPNPWPNKQFKKVAIEWALGFVFFSIVQLLFLKWAWYRQCK